MNLLKGASLLTLAKSIYSNLQRWPSFLEIPVSQWFVSSQAILIIPAFIPSFCCAAYTSKQDLFLCINISSLHSLSFSVIIKRKRIVSIFGWFFTVCLLCHYLKITKIIILSIITDMINNFFIRYNTIKTFPDKTMNKICFSIFASISTNTALHVTIMIFISRNRNLPNDMNYLAISRSSIQTINGMNLINTSIYNCLKPTIAQLASRWLALFLLIFARIGTLIEIRVRPKEFLPSNFQNTFPKVKSGFENYV